MSRLPLFPLGSIVLPGGQLPLRIFEPRYLSMVKECLKTDAGFGICLVSGGSEVGEAAEIFSNGTLVNIIDWDREESGLLVIVTQGIKRFRVLDSVANSDGLLTAEVEWLTAEDETHIIPAEYKELADLLILALQQVRPLLEFTEANSADAAWVSNRLIELLPMPAAERHSLIAMSDPLERLSVLQSLVESQT